MLFRENFTVETRLTLLEVSVSHTDGQQQTSPLLRDAGTLQRGAGHGLLLYLHAGWSSWQLIVADKKLGKQVLQRYLTARQSLLAGRLAAAEKAPADQASLQQLLIGIVHRLQVCSFQIFPARVHPCSSLMLALSRGRIDLKSLASHSVPTSCLISLWPFELMACWGPCAPAARLGAVPGLYLLGAGCLSMNAWASKLLGGWAYK